MKVKDLIQKLQKLDGDTDIMFGEYYSKTAIKSGDIALTKKPNGKAYYVVSNMNYQLMPKAIIGSKI